MSHYVYDPNILAWFSHAQEQFQAGLAWDVGAFSGLSRVLFMPGVL